MSSAHVAHALAEPFRPVSLAREQVLPVAAPWAELFPAGGLERGTVVCFGGNGATSVALALLAEASASGSWVAVLGVPSLGLVAAAELGVRLERLVCVEVPARLPPVERASLVAALVGAFDVVVLGASRLGQREARRLRARCRERGTVLVELGARDGEGLGGDVRFRVRTLCWEGLGAGHGLLRRRTVEVRVDGRGRAARPVVVRALLGG